jgi:hypothetical protein
MWTYFNASIPPPIDCALMSSLWSIIKIKKKRKQTLGIEMGKESNEQINWNEDLWQFKFSKSLAIINKL